MEVAVSDKSRLLGFLLFGHGPDIPEILQIDYEIEYECQGADAQVRHDVKVALLICVLLWMYVVME